MHNVNNKNLTAKIKNVKTENGLEDVSIIGYDKINQANYTTGYLCFKSKDILKMYTCNRILEHSKYKDINDMNKLYKMTAKEFEEKKILYKHSDTKYIVMDGSGITTYEEYFDRLWQAFGFSDLPEGWKKDNHSEYDFMTDDDFLPNDKYVFIIKNYEQFMRSNPTEKSKIEKRYNNYLLPFWDEEVERVVVDGKRKDFNIYLVSNE